jgi:hypothetical protein
LSRDAGKASLAALLFQKSAPHHGRVQPLIERYGNSTNDHFAPIVLKNPMLMRKEIADSFRLSGWEI